jgi:hypothetical protein
MSFGAQRLSDLLRPSSAARRAPARCAAKGLVGEMSTAGDPERAHGERDLVARCVQSPSSGCARIEGASASLNGEETR